MRDRTWYKKNKDRVRYKMYGLTPEAYKTLLDKQGRACAVCRKKTELVVDHDHDSRKVRGLLCRGCNTFVKDQRTLEIALDYVKRANLNI